MRGVRTGPSPHPCGRTFPRRNIRSRIRSMPSFVRSSKPRASRHRHPRRRPHCCDGLRSISPVCRRARRRSRPSSRTIRPRVTRRWSIGCSRRRATANAWRGAGSKPDATRTPTATRQMPAATCGAGAIGSSKRTTATCRSTGSPSSNWLATCCRTPRSINASPPDLTATIEATRKAASCLRSMLSSTSRTGWKRPRRCGWA